MQCSSSTDIIRFEILVLLITAVSLVFGAEESRAYGEHDYSYEVYSCWDSWGCATVPKTPCCYEKCAFSACTKTSPWDSALTACSPQLNAYSTCMRTARPIQSHPMPVTPQKRNCSCEDWDGDGRFGVVLNGTKVLKSNIGSRIQCQRYANTMSQCTGKQ